MPITQYGLSPEVELFQNLLVASWVSPPARHGAGNVTSVVCPAAMATSATDVHRIVW